MSATHEVTNQVPPLVGHDPIAGDAALAEACVRHADAATLASLADLGRLAGSEQAQEWGRVANENPPKLRTHDRYGHRDRRGGVPPVLARADAHRGRARPGRRARGPAAAQGDRHAHVRRAVGYLGWTQVEMGHACPMTMTYAAVPALRRTPELAARYEPGLTAAAYQFGLAEPTGKARADRRHGHDREAGRLRRPGQHDARRPAAGRQLPPDRAQVVHLRADERPVPRPRPARRGRLLLPRARGCCPTAAATCSALQRLKDKLGDRSNASSEVEFDGTTGWLVGEPGPRACRRSSRWSTRTRLDCVLGSAATVRAALTQAIHHARHRRAFGALLVDQPLMQNVLADLAVESEAATALAIRLAAAVDAGESAFLRLAGAAAKFWVCKRTPGVVAEAMEVLGGNGYVEESGLPRLYRQSPLNSIWEGSGNVIALDVLRAMGRSSDTLAAVTAEIELARGADPRFDDAVKRLHAELGDPDQLPLRARRIAGLLALCLQGSLLLRHAPQPVADAFCASRLGGDWGAVLGTLPAGTAVAEIVERARVEAV